MKEQSDDVHVIPNWGKEHECSSNCFCEPEVSYIDEFTGKTVWIHKTPEELCQ